MRGLYLLIVLLVAAPAGGQTDTAMGLLVSSEVGDQLVTADYDVDHYFEVDADQRGRDLGFTRHDLHLRVPISQDEHREWTFGLGFTALDLETDVEFPDSSFLWRRDVFPGELYDVQFDTTYRQRLTNDWIIGGQFAVSSPSDRPFASLEEMSFTFNASLRIPQGESDAWMLFLNYASNREFLPHIPIPGVGYQLDRERIRALIGVPVSTVHYEPWDWLHLDARYFVPRSIDAEVSVLPTDELRFHAGYHWTNDRYLRHDRRDDDDRLFLYEQNVSGGVEWKITGSISVDVHGGYAFNRFVFEGEEYSDRGQNRIDVDDGPFVGARVAIRF
jgi:hypothetical protein